MTAAAHVAHIAALVLERPLCVECIALKASLSSGAVEGLLAVTALLVDVRRQRGACRACGSTTEVISTTTERVSADP